MESKKYNKLVKKTTGKQTTRCREQSSGYSEGERAEGEGQYRSRGKRKVITDYMKSRVLNFWKLQNTIEFKNWSFNKNYLYMIIDFLSTSYSKKKNIKKS